MTLASVSHAAPQAGDTNVNAAETAERIYHSWQVDHPVAMGVVSAVSFALIPARFGDDVEEREGGLTMNYGYGRHAYDYVYAASHRIFDGTRSLVFMMMAILATLILYRSRASIATLATRIRAKAVKR
jgi:hypothetical protein